MKTKHIIIGLIIVLVVLFFVQKKEHAGSTQALSNEAVQNIAKVYADTTGTATFNNTKATGTSDFNIIRGYGEATFNGNTTFKSSVKDAPTHFPYSDGKNYIRGPTQIDGDTTINGLIKMNKGFEARSPNGQYYLTVQDNGVLTLRDKNNSNKALWSSGDTVMARKAYGIKSPWHYLGNNNRTAYFGPEGPENAGYQQAMYIMPTNFENYKSEP
jgi:hypothetical protein